MSRFERALRRRNTVPSGETGRGRGPDGASALKGSRRRHVVEEVKKVWDAAKGGWEIGKDINETTGAGDAWGNAAYEQDPELAKSAADDWDKGDHAKAVGKFVYASGAALVEGVGDFFEGLTGQVDAEAPPTLDIESHEDVSMSSSSVAYEDPPPPPSE